MFDIKTNTPLRVIPEDYLPEGAERWFTLTEGYDAGKTIFYYDWQPEDVEPQATILFVHGNPECSYTYRHIRDGLIASGAPVRIIMMDHIGFGLSDQADYQMICFHHAHNVNQLIRHLDLRDFTLVVHDWGGPIGIGAVMDDPSRVSALLVMNTTVFPMPQAGLRYTNFPFRVMPWCKTPYMIPDALWGGVAAAVVTGANPQGFLQFNKLIAGRLYQYGRGRLPVGSPEYVFSEQFRTKANAVSSQRNVLQTPVWGHGYSFDDPKHGPQDNHAFYDEIHEKVPAAWGGKIPVAGFFGQWDPCGKDEVIAQWHEALPQMAENTHTFPEIGHFIEEYKGPEMAQALLKFNGLLRVLNPLQKCQ